MRSMHLGMKEAHAQCFCEQFHGTGRLKAMVKVSTVTIHGRVYMNFSGRRQEYDYS